MIESWMRADPLMAILLDRGERSEFAYEVVERVSWLVLGGMSELAAIDSVLGYVPHALRASLEPQPPPSPKEAL